MEASNVDPDHVEAGNVEDRASRRTRTALARRVRHIAALREVADAHSATPAQIALAWVIHPPGGAIPVASSVEQMESNAAADITLTGDEYQALQAASARFRPSPDSHRCSGWPAPGSAADQIARSRSG